MIALREVTTDLLSVDHTIEVEPLTGGSRLSIPVRTSAGRDGFGPALALGYGSGAPNSAFGLGWSLSGVPSIARDTTRRIPSYRDDADRYIYGGGTELIPARRLQGAAWVPVAEQRGAFLVERFRSRIERSYERFERWTEQPSGQTHWVVYSRGGVVSVFGLAADGSTRIADPEDPGRRAFEWLLEAQYDAKGNAILYRYKPEDAVDIDPTLSYERGRRHGALAQRYLKQILYGNSKPVSPAGPPAADTEWRFEVVFDYGEHAGGIPSPQEGSAWPVRADPCSWYRAGFEIRTYRLCRRILMFHRFPELGAAPRAVGATELTHREDPAGSVLEAVRYRGYRTDLATNATTELAVPPLELGYSPAQTGPAFESPEEADNLPSGLYGARCKWVDLRGEGVPGILHQQGGGWYYKENLGGGRFGPLEPVDEVPAAISAAFQLDDYDGDGDLDFVGFEGREAGHYTRDRETGRWDGFQPLRDLPRVDFVNARVQWVDLNGDGLADLVVDHGDRLVWYPSEGRDGFAPPVQLARPDAAAGGSPTPTLIQDRQLRTFFADMTGDGLPDLVRVDSGRVEYWPHLGLGRFGAGVVMERSPFIDGFNQLDPARLRFADLDGSGTADLIYLDSGEVRYWINRSGNSYGDEVRLRDLPYIDQIGSAQIVDFLGDGTSCLVWSSGLPAHEGRAMQYLRLNGPLPPRLLVSVRSGIGREAALSYRSSAREFLRDKHAGRPWHTLLPRHPMVVDRFEGLDRVGNTRVASCYRYHDGCYDGHERRMVGFGMVETLDTDQLRATGATAPEEVTPPALSRTWFHNGGFIGLSERAEDFYRLDAQAARLPPPAIADVATLSTEEQVDAYRALGGLPWRQEYFSIRPDDTVAPHPLRTVEYAHEVRRLQPADGEHDAVFAILRPELLTHEYEEQPGDPRVRHELVLATDPYGCVTRRASLAYPRRAVGSAVRDPQKALHAQLVETVYGQADTADRFEVGIELEERRYDLTGLVPGAGGTIDRAGVLAQTAPALANPLAFHDSPVGGGPEARLIGWRRNRFWNDARTAALPPGQVGGVTLLHHVERAALPDAAVAAAFGGRVDAALLSGDGHYVLADGHWWSEDTEHAYRDAAGFYRLEEERNARGGRQRYTFDPHFLLVTAIDDVLGNRIEGTPDYQALASARVRDANENVSETRYDPLGAPTVTAVRGQQLGEDGNPHLVGAEDLGAYVEQAVATAADVLADPARFLQRATRFVFHDLGAFARGEGPPRIILLERELDAHDGQGSAPGPSRIRMGVRYLDGFGRVIQNKLRVDPGPAVQRDAAGAVVLDAAGRPVLADSAERWLTSGHDVLNNKGWTVRTFEPLFSTTPAFESDDALRFYGVATRTHYDPAGRVVRQDLPNGSFTTSAYSAWSIVRHDANDTVVGSDWEAARAGLPAGDPERAALAAAQAHADTPSVVELDPLGRPFRVAEDGGGGVERVSLTGYDADGEIARVVDARGLTAFSYRRDMLGRPYLDQSMDAGDRVILYDALDRGLQRWDARGVRRVHRYDRNGRITAIEVDGALGLDHVVERVVYGDEPVVAQAALRNARGRVVERYDDAGVVRVVRYHFDGQIAEVTRTLRGGADAHKTTADWSNPASVPLDGVDHRSRYRFDGLGRLVEQTLPDGTSRELAYGVMGHLTELRLTTADGQLQRKIIAGDMELNARGQRTRLRHGNGVETTFEYQPDTFRLSRLLTRRTAGGARDYFDIGYTYDPAGNITRWVDRVQEPTAPAPLLQGLAVTSACEFTYDAFYQLRTATGRVHQALLQHDYRDGLPDANALKGTRHLTLNNGAAVERYTRSYEYDLGGNLTRVRHVGASRTWVSEKWTSPTSNRSLPKQDLGGAEIPTPETHFDANGNTIGLPHLRAMDWNHSNRLARAVVIDRSAAGQPDDAEYYVYDADGLRVRRVSERLVAGQIEVTETTYLDECEMRRISRGGNTRMLRWTSHVSEGSTRIATLHQWTVDQSARETDDIGQKKLHYLVGNLLGSVVLELDEVGGVISYEEYFPFGGTSFIAGDEARDVRLKEYRYSGKLRDDVTGFYCYEYRYYSPFIGGWLSPDPLGPVDGLNVYRFVHNNPIRFSDPDGLQTGAWAAGDLKSAPQRIQQAAVTNTPQAAAAYEAYAESLVFEANGKRYRADVEVVPITENGEFVRWWGEIVDVEEVTTESISFDEEEIVVGGKQGEGEGKEQGEGGEGDEDSPAQDSADGKGETGEGKGAGAKGQGKGGGGQGQGAGAGKSGSGKNSGTGTGVGTGNGQGTGAAENSQSAPKHGGGEKGKGQPGGKPGGTGTDPSAAKGPGGEGEKEQKGGDGGQPLPGAPTGPDGIPLPPDLELPDDINETGRLVADPSEIHKGTENGDPRGDPGSDGGTATRPGGVAGGAPEGEGAADERGKPGSPKGGEGGEAGGEEGGLRGGSGWLTLPSWLSMPLNFIADKVSAVIDYVQTGLDIIGLIPGLGEIADGLNGLISLARGDYVGASLSFAAMVPFAGWAATAGKFGRKAAKGAEAVADITRAASKYGDEVSSLVKFGERHADEAAELVTKNADDAAKLVTKNADEAAQAVSKKAGDLAKGAPLPDEAVVHRIGGGAPENLKLSPQDLKADTVGLSVLEGGTPEAARKQMLDAFPNATRMHKKAEIVGTATVSDVRKAGFEVIHDPTKNFPNHGLIVHPNGVPGFTDEALEGLSKAFKDTFFGAP